jgi:hypothetical protein
MTKYDDRDSRESSFREKLIEHVFVAELMQEAWLARGKVPEVLRAEVDSSGYDLVIECGDVMRHVQLKSSKLHAATRKQTIQMKLAEKPGGCVVWVFYEEDPGTSRVLLTYKVFAGQPGEKLPELGTRVGRNPRSKTDRPTTREVAKSQFESVPDMSALFSRLFG